MTSCWQIKVDNVIENIFCLLKEFENLIYSDICFTSHLECKFLFCLKPYRCPTCDLKFTSSGNLKTHMKLHVGTREYQCHLCEKAYPRADTLKRHILSFHENKRLYKCDVCGKSFKGHIRDHMRTHADDQEEKPFGCHQCGARFNQRSQLTVHMVSMFVYQNNKI